MPPISSACAITFSSVPYCASHFAAVFGPTLATPGTLSIESPVSVSRSSSWSARTPNFAATPASSSISLLMVLTSATRDVTSCARSLSPVEIKESMPDASPRRTSVPSTGLRAKERRTLAVLMALEKAAKLEAARKAPARAPSRRRTMRGREVPAPFLAQG